MCHIMNTKSFVTDFKTAQMKIDLKLYILWYTSSCSVGAKAQIPINKTSIIIEHIIKKICIFIIESDLIVFLITGWASGEPCGWVCNAECCTTMDPWYDHLCLLHYKRLSVFSLGYILDFSLKCMFCRPWMLEISNFELFEHQAIITAKLITEPTMQLFYDKF